MLNFCSNSKPAEYYMRGLVSYVTAAALPWLILLLLIPQDSALAQSISYIYVEASEGNSSGGHTALRIADNVYHFQYADLGIIRLEKHHVADFEFLYRFLDNRTLHISRVDISEETYSLLLEHFNFQYQLQKQQLKLRNDLRDDRRLLKQLLFKHNQETPNLLRLEGAGLFYSNAEFAAMPQAHPVKSATQSNTIKELREEIQDRFGATFFSRRNQELVQKIIQLRPPTRNIEKITLTADSYPPVVYSFANRYIDLVTDFLAIKVLEKARDLEPDSYFMPPQAEFALTIEEIAALHVFRYQLKEGLIKLMQSKRPDRGYALLVNAARLITIDKSIQTGRLVFLDTFATNDELTTEINLPKYSAEINAQTAETSAAFRAAKSKLNNKTGGISEQEYSRLEMLGNHYAELLRTSLGNTSIRLKGANLLPIKSINLPNLLNPDISEQELQQALHRLDDYTDYINSELKRLYTYNLLSRNCVTELFRAIDDSFLQQRKATGSQRPVLSAKQASEKRLGGFVSMAPINFIPFTSYSAVQRHYNISETLELPSFRLGQLEQLYRNEHSLLVFLRENNTLSSTLYKNNEQDSFFIFFTDNTVLLRPVYGLFNTLAGLGQSLFGLVSWPFDSGKTLHSGLSGVLMSLPEMAFVNMRKGSFMYLPFSPFNLSETTMTRSKTEF